MMDAVYSKQELEEYSGNPLIEALPPILKEQEVLENIKYFPQYDEKQRNADDSIRVHYIARLDSYVDPFPKQITLERRISVMIRNGYIERNPLSKEYKGLVNLLSDTANSKGTNRIQHVPPRLRGATNGFTLIGISGIGKTTSMKRILSIYPQTILHTEYNGKPFTHVQITWLEIQCPHEGSEKSLCKNFFEAVDKLIGTNYTSKFAADRISIETMLIHMAHVANLHTIGAIFIDEIQNLHSSRGSEKLLNFFVSLVNKVGVPIVFVGTYLSYEVLTKDFRQARRASGWGEILWPRWENDEDWDWFLEGLWVYQWTKDKTPLTPEIREAMYTYSQGIIYRAIVLYRLAQWWLLGKKSEIITPELIKKIYEAEMPLTKEMIDALRTNNYRELAKFPDIKPISYDEIVEHIIEDKKQSERVKRILASEREKMVLNKSEASEQIALWLIQSGEKLSDAQRYASEVLKEFDVNTTTIEKLKMQAAMKALRYGRDKNSEAPVENSNKETKCKDLRDIHKKAKEDGEEITQALKNENYIKNNLEEF